MLRAGLDAHNLGLDPLLEFRDLGEAIGDLEALQLADDLGGASVLVEVDDGHAFAVAETGELCVIPSVERTGERVACNTHRVFSCML